MNPATVLVAATSTAEFRLMDLPPDRRSVTLEGDIGGAVGHLTQEPAEATSRITARRRRSLRHSCLGRCQERAFALWPEVRRDALRSHIALCRLGRALQGELDANKGAALQARIFLPAAHMWATALNPFFIR